MIKPLRIAQGTAWEAIVRPLDVLLRDVVAALNRGAPQLACVIDTAALPVTVTLPHGVTPRGLRLTSATVQSSGDGVVLSGGAIAWDAQGAGVVRIHSIDALASSTRYDAVIAVEE